MNKTKPDKWFIIVLAAVGGTVIIGDLGMHLLFGPTDTPINTALSIISKLNHKNSNEAGGLVVGTDPVGTDVMRPFGWEGKFANYTAP